MSSTDIICDRQLVSLGALITVLSLAIGPFTQEVISYRMRQIQTGSPPARRTQEYTAIKSGMGPFDELDYSMKGAVYNGIFADEPVADLQPICPTGNCTWPSFLTLAFCSACNDVTSSTNVTCEANSTTTAQACHYTLPSGMTLENSTDEYDSNSLVADIQANTSAASFAGIHNPLFAFGFLNNTGHNIAVADCALFLCVQTFETSVSGGIPESSPVASWWPDDEELRSASETSRDMVLTPPPTPKDMDYAAEKPSSYVVEHWEIESLQEFLNWGSPGPNDVRPNRGIFTGNITENEEAGTIHGSDTLAAIRSSPNISTLFSPPFPHPPFSNPSNIATSMTNVLRSYGNGSGNDTVFGAAYSTEVYINVRWQWLTLAVVSLTASSIFLGTVMVISRRNHIPVWKSSSLAMLFHGIDERGGLGPLDEVQAMEVRATNMKVALRDEEAGYKLV